MADFIVGFAVFALGYAVAWFGEWMHRGGIDWERAHDELGEVYADVSECHDSLLVAAKHLLLLKNGPRDATYRAHKDGAWSDLREAVAGCEAADRWDINRTGEWNPTEPALTGPSEGAGDV